MPNAHSWRSLSGQAPHAVSGLSIPFHLWTSPRCSNRRGKFRLVRLLECVPELPAQPRVLRIASDGLDIPWPFDGVEAVQDYLTVTQHDDTIGHQDGLIEIVGHQQSVHV